jgi:hypothetical protein
VYTCAVLCTVFVSPSLIAQTDAAVDETLRNSSWLDVATVLPPSLGPPDVAQLLDKCAELPSGSDNKRGQVGNFDGCEAARHWRLLFDPEYHTVVGWCCPCVANGLCCSVTHCQAPTVYGRVHRAAGRLLIGARS